MYRNDYDVFKIYRNNTNQIPTGKDQLTKNKEVTHPSLDVYRLQSPFDSNPFSLLLFANIKEVGFNAERR